MKEKQGKEVEVNNVGNPQDSLVTKEGSEESEGKLESLREETEGIRKRIEDEALKASKAEEAEKTQDTAHKIKTREESIKERQDSLKEIEVLEESIKVDEEAKAMGILEKDEVERLEEKRRDLIEQQKKRDEGLKKYNETMADPEVSDSVFTEARNQNNEIIVEKEVRNLEEGIKSLVKAVQETAWVENCLANFRHKYDKDFEAKGNQAEKIREILIDEIERKFPTPSQTLWERMRGAPIRLESEIVTLFKRLTNDNAGDWGKTLQELYYGKIEKRLKKDERQEFVKVVKEKTTELDRLKELGGEIHSYKKERARLYANRDEQRKNAILLYKTLYDVALSGDEKHREEFSGDSRHPERKIVRGLNMKIYETINEMELKIKDEKERKRILDDHKVTFRTIQQYV